MYSVKWDVKEIMSQHSLFVDVLLRVCHANLLALKVSAYTLFMLQEFAKFKDLQMSIDRWVFTDCVDLKLL